MRSLGIPNREIRIFASLALGLEGIYESEANNTASKPVVRFLAAFSQSTHIVVSSSLLIYGPLVCLTDFIDSYAQVGCKLTTRFFSLSSPLSSISAFSQHSLLLYLL
jgi:hypothetical protein